jgi:hypothetical protein
MAIGTNRQPLQPFYVGSAPFVKRNCGKTRVALRAGGSS